MSWSFLPFLAAAAQFPLLAKKAQRENREEANPSLLKGKAHSSAAVILELKILQFAKSRPSLLTNARL